MQLGRRIAILLSCAAFLFPISIAAGREGFAHDQSFFCEIVDLPPPFLGFEYWTETGFMLGVFATGLIVAAFLSVRNSSDDADSEDTA